MFIGFSAWDVVAGDRAELLEHGTYVGVVFMTATFLVVTQFKPLAVMGRSGSRARPVTFAS